LSGGSKRGTDKKGVGDRDKEKNTVRRGASCIHKEGNVEDSRGGNSYKKEKNGPFQGKE